MGIVTATGAYVKTVSVDVSVGCIVDLCMNYPRDIKYGHIATSTGFSYGDFSLWPSTSVTSSDCG